MATIIPQLTNHIGVVIDASGSMYQLSKKVVEVFDALVLKFRQRSQETNQETRISVYLFSDDSRCVVFDMDVMRPISLKDLYNASGNTALLDATGACITDLKKIPEIHSDHSFLVYVITDGQENASVRYDRYRHDSFSSVLKLPDNWTVAALAPDSAGVSAAKTYGFPAGNIEKWDISSARGFEEAVGRIERSFVNYTTARSAGVRGSSSLFTADLSQVKQSTVTRNLVELKGFSQFTVPATTYLQRKFGIGTHVEIRPFVESVTKKAYVTGQSFYELKKTEKVSGNKRIVVQHRTSGKVYGGSDARSILSIPDGDIRLTPGNFGEWKIFVESTSYNRHLFPGTEVLIFS